MKKFNQRTTKQHFIIQIPQEINYYSNFMLLHPSIHILNMKLNFYSLFFLSLITYMINMDTKITVNVQLMIVFY